MLLFAVFLPSLFVAAGAWSAYLAARSWRGRGSRPSETLAFAGASKRVRRFVDRCMLPLGLLYLSLGGALGSASALTQSGPGSDGFLTIVAGLTSAASAIFLALTVCVHRYSKPQWLIPAYLRTTSQPVPISPNGLRLK